MRRRQAKASGYRARSAFKLKQIQAKFELMREGDVVLDVGCHPGGWAQVAVEEVGDDGIVIGVDLQPCQPVEGALLMVGDITDPLTQERIVKELVDRQVNSVISDISPHITGKWDVDRRCYDAGCKSVRLRITASLQWWLVCHQIVPRCWRRGTD